MITIEDIKADLEDFKKDLIPEEIVSALRGGDGIRIIDIMIALDKQSAQAIEIVFQQNLVFINSALEFRSRKEKIEFINLRRQEILDAIGNDTNRGILYVLDMKIKEMPGLLKTVLSFLPSISEQIPEQLRILADQEFADTTIPLLTNMNSVNLDQIQGVLDIINSLVEKFPQIDQYVNVKRPLRTVIATTLFMYYDKHVISYLNNLLDELENPQPQLQLTNLEKIEWQGTQKELAELFVELEKKGWIKEKKAKLISQYFDKANTIFEVLKTTGFDEDGTPFYSNIYTKAYKPSFKEVKLNARISDN
jgi:hypothetical protein